MSSYPQPWALRFHGPLGDDSTARPISARKEMPAVTITGQTTQLYLDEVREIHQDWETGRLACPQPDGPCIKCQTRADDAAKCIPGLLAEIERLREALDAAKPAAATA